MPSPPLEGLLVVSLEQAVAAPMCSRRLADAGARVIKLERPEGDFARGYDSAVHGHSAYFIWLNRGKESICIDMRDEQDLALFEALIAKADVFIQNLKPGAIDRLGYPLNVLREKHPKLITCSISGYGDSGPYSGRKAYDLLIQAESGLASVTGEPEQPSRIGVSIVDVGTGMTAYEAILEALIARGRTGEGTGITVSMFDTMAELMAVPLLQGRYDRAPKRVGLRHPSIAPYGVFTCSDGTPILIAIQNDREWKVFAREVLDDEAVGTNPKFATNLARVENRPETDAMVGKRLGLLAPTEAGELLSRADIAFGMVNDVPGVLAHPCLRDIAFGLPDGGTAMIAAPPAIFTGDARDYGPVPAVGAHTDAVRREFLD